MASETGRPTEASTICKPRENATVKLVSELEVRNTDTWKYIRRICSLTMDMPENMRQSVATEEQMKVSVLAIMNASKYHAPKCPDMPPGLLLVALTAEGKAKVAPNVIVVMSTEPMLSVRVESVN